MSETAEGAPVAGTAPARRHGIVAGKMALLAAAMFGFGYLMVPLYDIICDLTGLNGKTGRVSSAEAEAGCRAGGAGRSPSSSSRASTRAVRGPSARTSAA